MLRQNKKFGKLLIMVAVRFEVLIPHSVRITYIYIYISQIDESPNSCFIEVLCLLLCGLEFDSVTLDLVDTSL